MPIPNHRDVVERWRAVFDALAGDERAYQIVNAVAYELANEGCGVYAKPNGPHGVSQDVVIFKPNAETFDILGDAEGEARPQWSRTAPTGFGDLSRWRAAVRPDVPGTPPEEPPGPDPQPTPCDLQPVLEALVALTEKLATLEREVVASRTLTGTLSFYGDRPFTATLSGPQG
jgi:hypothetical protein